MLMLAVVAHIKIVSKKTLLHNTILESIITSIVKVYTLQLCIHNCKVLTVVYRFQKNDIRTFLSFDPPYVSAV